MAFCRKQLFAIVLCMTSASASAQPSVPGSEAFVLRDFIGRIWRNESVRFPASAAQFQSAQAGLPLVGPDGKPTLYQVVSGKPASIEFLADLDPFERRDYRFAATAEPAAATDLAMMQVFQIREAKRPLIPAVTHVDGSGRLQTVSKSTNSLYYRLIDMFRAQTGVPMLLNTSFNENEPVVCEPREALDCFLRTKMDMLVMGNVVLSRDLT